MGTREQIPTLSPVRSPHPKKRAATVERSEVVIAASFVAAILLVAAMLIIAAPVGEHLFPNGHFGFFRGVMVYRKPAEQTRYLLAVAFVLIFGLVVARARLPHALTDTATGRAGVRLASICGLLTIGGVAVWGWWAQFHYTGGEPPTVHFGNGNLIAAIAIAAALTLIAQIRPKWLNPRPFMGSRSQGWSWFFIAALLTVCWLLPSVFREQNLAVTSREVTYHLQFTFDDFAAVVDGRTPLVNYAEQYSSLLPFVVWPVFRVLGTQVGSFTVTMCFLSLIGLLAVERVLALITRNERLALALYIPFLATSLFFILRNGSQLFSWASYYAVFPMRYVGPYVLLWLCTRHLRGLRPRSSIVIFTIAGLVALNNVEFGLPALAGTVAALAVTTKPERSTVLSLAKDLVLGLVLALAGVSILTLLLTGQLPNLGLLTLYSRLFGEGGFGLFPTPIAGLYLIVDMTFAAAILMAAIRYRTAVTDTAYTAVLAYSGVFGLGAGNYYMGRTHPAGLVVLFSIWALTVVLLALLALRTVTARRGHFNAPVSMLVTAALVSFGLVITSITQFPAPWTQVRRIAASAPAPPPYDLSAAVAFIRRTATHREAVVLLSPLGHLIALDAGVENVSPYSNQEDIVTYQQLGEELAALHDAGGKRFYIGGGPYFPEITSALAREGFVATADRASGLTEWQRR
jgi:hypothetical protein